MATSYSLNFRSTTYISDASTSAATTPIFVITKDGTSCQMPDGTNNSAGVMLNVPPLASLAQVAYDGVCAVTVDNAYTVGTFLKGAVGTGLGTQAYDGTDVSNLARAITLEASAASGDIIAVRLIDAIGATSK